MIDTLQRHLSTGVFGGFFAIAIMVAAPSVQAQGVSPTAGQEQLNDQAVEAAISGNFDKAVRLFRASLDLGELNVTYLNLGRALFKLGQCAEADEAYGKALTAPRVTSPTPAEIEKFVADYRGEFEEKCPGTVRIACVPDTLKFSVDDGIERVCRGTVQLPPGMHTFTALYDDQRIVRQVRVSAMSTQSVRLEAEHDIETKRSTVATWAWISSGVGGALVLTGLLIDGAVIGPDFDKYEEAAANNNAATYHDLKDTLDSEQSLNLLVFITGGVALATGGGLFLYDAGVFGGSEHDDGSAGLVQLGGWATGSSRGVSWSVTF